MSFDDVKAAVADQAGVSKAETSEVLAAFFAHLKTTLGQGDKISLPGLGQFEVGERAAREGRNPRTGETIAIPASKTVRFKAAKALKEAVND